MTAAAGIMFDEAHPFIVDHVIRNGCADLADNKIEKGDELISVAGVKTDAAQNREFYFMQTKVPDEMVLGFRPGGK